MQDRPSAAAGAPRLGLFDSAKAMLATASRWLITVCSCCRPSCKRKSRASRCCCCGAQWRCSSRFSASRSSDLLVVIAWWDDHALLAAGLIAVLFLLLAVVAGFVAAAQVRAKPLPFNASLGELAKDYDQLKS